MESVLPAPAAVSSPSGVVFASRSDTEVCLAVTSHSVVLWHGQLLAEPCLQQDVQKDHRMFGCRAVITQEVRTLKPTHSTPEVGEPRVPLDSNSNDVGAP